MNTTTIMHRMLLGLATIGLLGGLASASDKETAESKALLERVPVMSVAGVVGEAEFAVGAILSLPGAVETGPESRLAIAFRWADAAAGQNPDILLIGPNTTVRFVKAAAEDDPPKGFAAVVAEIGRGAFRAVMRNPGGLSTFSVKAGERATYLVDADVIGSLDPGKDDATFLLRSGAITVKSGTRTLRLKAGMARTIEGGKIRGAKRFTDADWEQAAARVHVPQVDVSQPQPPPAPAPPARPETPDRPVPTTANEKPPPTIADERPQAPVEEDYVTVRMITSMGDIDLQLDRARAPITVANFLSYVERGFYDETIIHRVVRGYISVVQGGGYGPFMQRKTPEAPIANEWRNGLKNVRGSIAMARQRIPDSATSQFFINVKDNPVLDEPRDGAAYAVFGKVVRGMDVVDAMGRVPTKREGPTSDIPVEEIVVRKVRVIAADATDQ